MKVRCLAGRTFLRGVGHLIERVQLSALSMIYGEFRKAGKMRRKTARMRRRRNRTRTGLQGGG